MVVWNNPAGLKYTLKVKLTRLELLTTIWLVAKLRSETLKTAAKLSTEYTTSQPNHSKLLMWVNCEDANPMKNKGRVYTVIRKITFL